jgi:hypothetical protein
MTNVDERLTILERKVEILTQLSVRDFTPAEWMEATDIVTDWEQTKRRILKGE